MRPVTSFTRPHLLRRLTINTLLVLVSALTALALAEGFVRLVSPQQLIIMRPDLWQPADSVGWLRRPNISVRINTGERTVSVLTDREGFRVGQTGRREAATQILLLGDSFMEALQVDHEQHVAHLLEGELERRLRRPVAIRNAGVSGWDPNHYYLRTRQLLERDTFALVVVAIFAGNDAVTQRVSAVPARQPMRQPRFRLPRALSRVEIVDALFAPVNDQLERHSQLFILLKNRLSVVRMRLGLTAQYMPPEFLRSESASSRWRVTAELSRDLSALAARHGTPTLFVLLPESFQVYQSVFKDFVRGFGIDSAALDLDQPNRRLMEEFKAVRLNVVDALPAFRSDAANGPRLFGSVDTHFAPAAHALLAKFLAPHAESLLVPPRRTSQLRSYGPR